MSTVATSPPDVARRWRLTSDEFMKLVDVGILQEDDRVELLDGEMFEMAPTGDWHNSGTGALMMALGKELFGRAVVFSQSSLRLGEHFYPMPDLAVLKYRKDYYRRGGYTAADVLFVVEVADSTARYDRETKLPLYAFAKVPEVWLVTRLPAGIEVFTDPRDGAYAESRVYRPGDMVPVRAFPDVEIAVSDVVG